MSETDLSLEVRKALAGLGVWTLRVNSGRAKVRRGYIHGAPAGTPDVVGYFPRWHQRALQLFAIETKASHRDSCKCDSCSAQRDWQREHEQGDGGIVYVRARSLQDALTGLGFVGKRFEQAEKKEDVSSPQIVAAGKA